MQTKNPAAVALGKLGGKRHGELVKAGLAPITGAPALKLTPEQRSASARKAAKARWATVAAAYSIRGGDGEVRILAVHEDLHQLVQRSLRENDVDVTSSEKQAYIRQIVAEILDIVVANSTSSPSKAVRKVPREGSKDGTPPQQDDAALNSLPDRIQQFLKSNREKRYRAEMIPEDVTKGAPIQTVRGALGRLHREKRILRVKRGQYQAKPEST